MNFVVGKKYLVRRRLHSSDGYYRDVPMKWDECEYRGVVDSVHQFAYKVRGFDCKALVTESDVAKRIREIPAADARGKAIRNHQRSLRNQNKLSSETRKELEAQSNWSWKYENYTGEEKARLLSDLRTFCRPLMLKHGLAHWTIAIGEANFIGPHLAYCCSAEQEIGFVFSYAAKIYYDAAPVDQTLLHEIAHALDPKSHPEQGKRGTEHGSYLKCTHPESWVRKAYEIGCRDFHGADPNVVQRVLISVNAPAGTYGTGSSISIVVGEREEV
jgi:phage gp16-like protein